MMVLDLFCGLRGWSQPFIDRGHDTWGIDIDPAFEPDVCADLLDVDAEFIMDNWGVPDLARDALKLVAHTLRLIRDLRSSSLRQYFIIENPRDKLRKLPMMQHLERRTVTYCHYGEKRMKPTDLWGGFPPSLRLLAPCKNGDPCHVSAPRGSQTGTQGMGSAEAAKVPYPLALDVCLAARGTYEATG